MLNTLYRDTAHCPIQLCMCYYKQFLPIFCIYFLRILFSILQASLGFALRVSQQFGALNKTVTHLSQALGPCCCSVVGATFMKTECLTRLWGCVTVGEPNNITCNREKCFLTTLLLFLRACSVGSIWMNMENWWLKLEYSEKTSAIHRLAWDRTYAYGVRGRRLAAWTIHVMISIYVYVRLG